MPRKKKEVKPEIIPHHGRMTSIEWCSNADRVNWLREMLSHDYGKQLLQVIRAEDPMQKLLDESQSTRGDKILENTNPSVAAGLFSQSMEYKRVWELITHTLISHIEKTNTSHLKRTGGDGQSPPKHNH